MTLNNLAQFAYTQQLQRKLGFWQLTAYGLAWSGSAHCL